MTRILVFVLLQKNSEDNLDANWKSIIFAKSNENKTMATERMSIEILQRLASQTLPKGCSVWLYGSRARGDHRQGSDWDVLILLDKAKVDNEDFDLYSYPLIQKGWDYGADISPQLYTRNEWAKMKITPYYQNVEQDKKVLYES